MRRFATILILMVNSVACYARRLHPVTSFASTEQLASGASPVRRFATILNLVASRASPVTRFASTEQLASGHRL